MNIEAIIYTMGVVTITSVLMLIIITAITLMVLAIKRGLYRELVSSYNHAQLRYFMKMLMDNGWTKTKDEVLTQKTQHTTEGDS